MAIGLSNVETRKVKKPSEKKAEGTKPLVKSRMVTTLIENSANAMDKLSTTSADLSNLTPPPAAVSAPARERKDRVSSSGELNSLWLDWSNRVAGTERESLTLRLARQWMEIERFVFDLVTEDVLRELRKTAFGVKVVSRVSSYRK